MAAGFAVSARVEESLLRTSSGSDSDDGDGQHDNGGGSGSVVRMYDPQMGGMATNQGDNRPPQPVLGSLPVIDESEELSPEQTVIIHVQPALHSSAHGYVDAAGGGGGGSHGRSTGKRNRKRRRKKRKVARPPGGWKYAGACTVGVVVGALFVVIMYAFRDHLGTWFNAL